MNLVPNSRAFALAPWVDPYAPVILLGVDLTSATMLRTRSPSTRLGGSPGLDGSEPRLALPAPVVG